MKTGISKSKLLSVSLILIIVAGSFYLGKVFAGASPTIPVVITPGSIGPCTWFISLDGTTPIAQAKVGGLSVSPGDNVVGTAGEDLGVFLNAITGQGQKYCFSGQTFTFSSTWNLPAIAESGQADAWGITGISPTGSAYFTKLQAGSAPSGTVFQSATGFTGSILFLGYNSAAGTGISNGEISGITFSGMPLPNTQSGSATLQQTAPNACIRGLDVENFVLSYLTIINCYRGIYFSTNGGNTNDGDEFHHIWFGYNRFGLWIDGQSQVISAHEIYGYVDYGNFIYIAATWTNLNDVFSNGDDYELLNSSNSTIRIISNGYFSGLNWYIANGKNAALAGIRAIQIDLGAVNATVALNHLWISGVNGNGIILNEDGRPGNVLIDDVHEGASPEPLGGAGIINGYGVAALIHRSDNENVTVINSDFTGCKFGALYGNFTFVSNIRSLVTTNSGVATILNMASTVTVTHQLGNTPATQSYAGNHLTPTYVLVTPSSNFGAGLSWWVSTVGSTTFVINTSSAVTGSQTFYWTAVWLPAGTQIGP